MIKRVRHERLILVVLAMALSLAAGALRAQQPRPPDAETPPRTTTGSDTTAAGPGRAAWLGQSPDSLRLLAPRTSLPDSLRDDDQQFKMFLDKIEVEGKLEKPQAIFIIPGSDPEIDDIQIQRSFFEEIFRRVEPAGRIGPRPNPASPGDRNDVLPW